MSVLVATSLGDIVIDLYTDRCPLTCKNFLKLCKIKYYHGCLFHTVQKDFTAQTGDPTGTGRGGDSIYKFLYGDQARFFSDEIHLDLKHLKKGTVAMASGGENLNASQFYITLRDDLDYLDGKHTVFGEVAEGFDALDRINETYVDHIGRPFKNIRIKHTYILDDPFEDPSMLSGFIPDASPEGKPKDEAVEEARLEDDWVPMDEQMDPGELEEVIRAKEAYSRAIVLETIGDIPDADVKPPDNVLFVCKLNPVTEDEDLHTIFSRFGVVSSAEIIRDFKTGDSLCYAFIEFDDEDACIEAYKKMDNALIDDRRIKVDFSQSVAKLWNNFRRKGSKDGKGCFKCGSLDHVAKDCTGDSTTNQRQKYVLKDTNVQRGGKKNASYDMVFEGEDGGSPRERMSHGRLSQGNGQYKQARDSSSDRHGSRREYEDDKTEKLHLRREERASRRKDDDVHHHRKRDEGEDREYRRKDDDFHHHRKRDEGEDREFKRKDAGIDHRKRGEEQEREYRRKDDGIDHRKRGEGEQREYRRKDDDIDHRKRNEEGRLHSRKDGSINPSRKGEGEEREYRKTDDKSYDRKRGDEDHDIEHKRRRHEDGDNDRTRVDRNTEVNSKRLEREGDESGDRSRNVQREHRLSRRSPDDDYDHRDRAHHRSKR